MYRICKTADTHADPVITFCPIASLVDDKNKYADLCLMAEGTTSSRVYLNSSMLLEAIANSLTLLNDIASTQGLHIAVRKLEKNTKKEKIVDDNKESITKETIDEKPKSLKDLKKENV